MITRSPRLFLPQLEDLREKGRREVREEEREVREEEREVREEEREGKGEGRDRERERGGM